MVSGLIWLALFSSYSHASTELMLGKTKVIFSQQRDFQYLPNANSFISSNEEGQVTIIRKEPKLVVNRKSVEKFWKENLLAVGLKAKKENCKAVSKFDYFCEYKELSKAHYLNWNRKDIVYVMITGKGIDTLRPQFSLVKE